MRKLERVATAVFGLAFMALPFLLRAFVFTEDTELIDGEFWGCIAVVACIFGTAILMQAFEKEENDG